MLQKNVNADFKSFTVIYKTHKNFVIEFYSALLSMAQYIQLAYVLHEMHRLHMYNISIAIW